MSTAEKRAATADKFRPPSSGRARPAPVGEVRDDPQVPDIVLQSAPADTDKTRSTVDLWPAEHEATNQLQRDIAFTLGVKSHKISRDMTLRLLLKLARTDQTTVRKLLGLMADELGVRTGER